MTEDELAGLFKYLRAAYPGEWDRERYALWAEAFDDYAPRTCAAALRAMVKVERWPSLAAFHEHARQVEPGEDGPFFAPGSGYLPEWQPRAIEGERYRPDVAALRERIAR